MFRPVRRSPIRPHALFGGGDNKEGGGGLGGLGNMANIMENMKKAQSLVQTEAAKVQEELSQYVLLAPCEHSLHVLANVQHVA